MYAIRSYYASTESAAAEEAPADAASQAQAGSEPSPAGAESQVPEDSELAPAGESIIAERMQAELATRFNPFVLSPHKQNYVLLASYNDTPNYGVITSYSIHYTKLYDVSSALTISAKPNCIPPAMA